MTTRREKLHATVDRVMNGNHDDQIHTLLDGVLNHGNIPDEQLPVDKQGTPLAFGNAKSSLSENMISDFNALGARLRGENKRKS